MEPKDRKQAGKLTLDTGEVIQLLKRPKTRVWTGYAPRGRTNVAARYNTLLLRAFDEFIKVAHPGRSRTYVVERMMYQVLRDNGVKVKEPHPLKDAKREKVPAVIPEGAPELKVPSVVPRGLAGTLRAAKRKRREK